MPASTGALSWSPGSERHRRRLRARLRGQRARVGFIDLDVAAAAGLADEIEASGAPRPVFVACDLLDIPALKAAFADLHGKLGDAAVLVNNAANDRRQDFLDVSEAEFDWSLAVNFKHHYFAAQAVVPQMRRLGFGSIVNMSSVAWMGGGPSMQAYSAAKAAVVGFTNSLARDIGKWRIRVNAIAPGMVITPRQRELWYQDESLIAAGRARQCLPDAIEPEESRPSACSSPATTANSSPSSVSR
jgi:NAD(P)-dependent dehydrogenase (short-subunit alcohol dehydrogenase family)